MSLIVRKTVAILVGAVIVLAIGQTALSATVTLGLISKQIAQGDSAGEWELWAWTSSGDNDGISGYTIDIAGDGIAGVHTSPVLTFEGIHFAGFTAGSGQSPNPGPVDW